MLKNYDNYVCTIWLTLSKWNFLKHFILQFKSAYFPNEIIDYTTLCMKRMTVAPWVQSFFGVSFQKRNYYIFVINYKTLWPLYLWNKGQDNLFCFSPPLYLLIHNFFSFLLWIMEKTGPAKYVGLVGICFHLLLAYKYAPYAYQKAQIKPTSEVCPHSIWNFSVGPAIMFLNQRSK